MKYEKFFYPLMILAAIVTVYLALRKPATTQVINTGGYSPSTIPPLAENVITPAANDTVYQYVMNPPPAGGGLGTEPPVLDSAVANSLSPAGLPSYFTTNAIGASNYSTAPIVEDDATVGACCATAGAGGCGNQQTTPPPLPDGAGMCAANSHPTIPASVVQTLSDRFSGYLSNNPLYDGLNVYGAIGYDGIPGSVNQ